MVEPYKLVIVNVIASVLLISSILFYKYIFPKKNISYPILLLLFSCLPLLSILRDGTYESGDLSLHAKFAMSFYESLLDGITIPRWAGILCGGYGCPHFIFIYILPYYLISFFHFLGFSFINSVKLLIGLSFIFSGFTFYLWAKEETNKFAAFIGSIFYLFAPYHLVDLHYRVAIGEILSFALLPLNFFLLKKLIETRSELYGAAESFVLFLLIISHLAISSSAFPFLVIYGAILTYRNRDRRGAAIKIILSLCRGILLSSFYLLPVIFEAKYTLYGLSPNINFESFFDLIYSKWRYGLLFQGPTGQLSFILGYAQLILIGIFTIYLIKKSLLKRDRLFSYFYLGSILFLFIMMQKITSPLWLALPIYNHFQFSYRLLILINLFIAILASYFSTIFDKRLVIFLTIFAIFSTVLNWGNRRVFPEINDFALRQQITGSSSGHDLIVPKWVDINSDWSYESPSSKLNILKGEARIKVIDINTIKHEYLVETKQVAVLRENTYYFPGWGISINGMKYPYEYTYKGLNGIMVFEVKPGIHHINVQFKDTWIRKFGDVLSILTLIFILMHYLYKLNPFSFNNNIIRLPFIRKKPGK